MDINKRLGKLTLLFAGMVLGVSLLLVIQNLPETVITSAEAAGGMVKGPN